MRERRTRRDAIGAGLAGAVALALTPATAGARGADDSDVLTKLARAERDAVYVYLNGAVAEIGSLLARHDLEHVRALATHLQALGLPIPAATRGRAGLGPEALAVLEARDPGARLRAARAYERSLVDGCARSLPALEHPNTVRTVATVMAGHAQHAALLERRVGIAPFSSRS
jgi:hypothetical protein